MLNLIIVECVSTPIILYVSRCRKVTSPSKFSLPNRSLLLLWHYLHAPYMHKKSVEFVSCRIHVSEALALPTNLGTATRNPRSYKQLHHSVCPTRRTADTAHPIRQNRTEEILTSRGRQSLRHPWLVIEFARFQKPRNTASITPNYVCKTHPVFYSIRIHRPRCGFRRCKGMVFISYKQVRM